MMFPRLQKAGLAVFDSVPSFGKFPENCYLLFVPAGGAAFFAGRAELDHWEKIIDTPIQDEELRALLQDHAEGKEPEIPDSPTVLSQLDILLNYKCNFPCSYCYSAHGRSQKEISFAKLHLLLQHFFSEKNGYRINKVVFSGGGEPLMSFPVLLKAVEDISSMTHHRAEPVEFSLVTNGSLIDESVMEQLDRWKIRPVVSFEILPDLQAKQRAMYERCAENIHHLIERNIIPGIRVTVTPASVSRLNEMLEELHRTFPEIRGVAFEAVVSRDLFADAPSLRTFYQTFIMNFSACRKKAQSMGIDAACTTFMALDAFRCRTCNGKICITPNGAITNCSRISSPDEAGYMNYRYGILKEDGTVDIDFHQYASQIRSGCASRFPECRTCWARRNCGGGCSLVRDMFPPDYFAEYCNFVRGALLQEIWDRLEETCQKNGTSIQNTLNEISRGGK